MFIEINQSSLSLFLNQDPFSSVPRSSKGLFTGYIYYNPRFRATLPRSSRATAILEEGV